MHLLWAHESLTALQLLILSCLLGPFWGKVGKFLNLFQGLRWVGLAMLLLIYSSLPMLMQGTLHGCLLSEFQAKSVVQALSVFTSPSLFYPTPCQWVKPEEKGIQKSDPNISIYFLVLHFQSSVGNILLFPVYSEKTTVRLNSPPPALLYKL